MATYTSTPASHKKLHIHAMTTVVPVTVTEPRPSRRISVDAPLRPEALKSHFRLVLYYKKASEEESALVVGGWIKESLAFTLSKQPVLAGRLRRDRENDGYWEIKFNDTGVRLVQASAETTMAEFLDSKDRDGGGEGMLAYWVDVDVKNPELSALFFIQVTEFMGDGYSIGISCSLLLADPIFLTRFLKTWSLTHTQMLNQGQLSKSPMFHIGYFKRFGGSTHLNSTPITTDTAATATATILFKVPSAPDRRALASLCLDEATRRLDGMAVSEFTFIANDHSGDLKIEFCDRNVSLSRPVGVGALNVVRWDELGAGELVFGEGKSNKPVHVSYRVVSGGHEGLVVAMLVPSDHEGASELVISARVPKKT